ncbi:MAG: hypothetical protein PHO46_09140 [Thermoguttaceae bacterium]|jgi:hypothetical protein|nr:hypothetical protein [Thermoguttaceae bacterium]
MDSKLRTKIFYLFKNALNISCPVCAILALGALCLSFTFNCSSFAQAPYILEPGYGETVPFNSSIILEEPFYPPQGSEYGIFSDFNSIQGDFTNFPLPVLQTPQHTTFTPQPLGDSNIISSDGSNYVILGDVTEPFNFASGMYDHIPFLNEGVNAPQRKLPELKIPQTDAEFIARVNILLRRFSSPNLSIIQSTPGRLLRYSLIAGADETFLAPSPTSQDEKAEESVAKSEMKPMYALGALCWNVPCSNRRLMRVINNSPAPKVGYGFQTQRGEFLAALAFAKVDRNYEIRVESKTFTVQDLVEWEKRSCSSYANLSLVAVGLAHYSQDPDEIWRNQSGEEWSLQKLLEAESRRKVDWNTADSTDKLLAFTYLLARLKQSSKANTPDLEPILQRTETFLLSMKKQVWDAYTDTSLCDSLFFNSETKLKTPYMKLYVNGRLLRWLIIVSSKEELETPKIKYAAAELCALVDQLFNSLDDLNQVSATDEESFAIALQTLRLYSKQLPQPHQKEPSDSEQNAQLDDN